MEILCTFEGLKFTDLFLTLFRDLNLNLQIYSQMEKLMLLVCLLYLVSAEPTSQEERQAILEYHNKMRGSVQPAASDMLKMVRWLNNFFNHMLLALIDDEYHFLEVRH